MTSVSVYYCFACDDIIIDYIPNNYYGKCSCNLGRMPLGSWKRIMSFETWCSDDFKNTISKDPHRYDYEISLQGMISEVEEYLSSIP